jgi:hypothetical protein
MLHRTEAQQSLEVHLHAHASRSRLLHNRLIVVQGGGHISSMPGCSVVHQGRGELERVARVCVFVSSNVGCTCLQPVQALTTQPLQWGAGNSRGADGSSPGAPAVQRGDSQGVTAPQDRRHTCMVRHGRKWMGMLCRLSSKTARFSNYFCKKTHSRYQPLQCWLDLDCLLWRQLASAHRTLVQPGTEQHLGMKK